MYLSGCKVRVFDDFSVIIPVFSARVFFEVIGYGPLQVINQ
jgi:hypothetical protein